MPEHRLARLLALDVQYRDEPGFPAPATATVAGVAFSSWSAPEPERIYTATVRGVEPYEPGRFYRRELPCLLALLREHGLQPEAIIIDGYVFLDGEGRPGLGKHLYDALERRTVVIGVAKTAYRGIDPSASLYRSAAKPLYISSVGVELAEAKRLIASMHGAYRLPDLLKRADRAARSPPGWRKG